MKIVVLPGLDGTGRLVDSFVHELAGEHDVQVISYPIELTSYSEIGHWLERHLPQDDFAIVAESFSGPLAIIIARHNPKTMKALVLVATFARSPRKLPSVLIDALNYIPYFPDVVAFVSLPFVVGRVRQRSFLASYRVALRKLPLATLAGRLRAVLEVDVRESLAGIDVPIAYIRATRDRLIPTSVSSDLRPYCDLYRLIDAPHFVLQTKPQEAADVVLDFLQERR